jgi:hypothetical protein
LRFITTRVAPPTYGSVMTHGSSVGLSALPQRDGISTSPHFARNSSVQLDMLACFTRSATFALYLGWNCPQ